jgi:hypothetical protein
MMASRAKMDRRKPSSVAAAFSDEAQRQFGLVAAELSLVGGPELTRTGIQSVIYRGDRVEYRIYYVPQDGSVLTAVHLTTVPPVNAYLDKLVAAARLGPVQHVRTSARGIHALKQSLASQASWVRRLHEYLIGDDGPDLMRRAAGSPPRE